MDGATNALELRGRGIIRLIAIRRLVVRHLWRDLLLANVLSALEIYLLATRLLKELLLRIAALVTCHLWRDLLLANTLSALEAQLLATRLLKVLLLRIAALIACHLWHDLLLASTKSILIIVLLSTRLLKERLLRMAVVVHTRSIDLSILASDMMIRRKRTSHLHATLLLIRWQ